ncbi:UDP-N-acetylglucosamine 2-epimerase (non-hydrolyzing) [Sutcliffiella horikoshii]|uniref:UDP-N-acetylglucosamine 2-epimerase (Non-hydrolyzing) n=1 Tax=Sutcliffiella horikoshii TaxID=79883 RepID=A0A5D4SV61_9BACI|nr:UDP-N-acetylglucosamine 2-epimerase (non-hydrolyzing) [Sutcliffiella horikoshii]TYS65736.1 UDP-N-acetylglucosamine 2-epimerase (non-hydrolyzing) [Sutcliffiella horikoshii]
MKIAVIVGTRPELIKMALLIKELKKRDPNHLFIHSGQHYDYFMDGMVMELFNLPIPDHHSGIGSGSHSETTAKIMTKMEKLILNEKINLLVVHGDTNTTLAASLAACKTNAKIAHVEAGLRSFDRTMPEEHNRILVDHLSNYLFCPTEGAVNNLKTEGITKGVHLVGQSIVDAVDYISNSVPPSILDKLSLNPKSYLFVTFHRQENTDNLFRLNGIVDAIHYLTTLSPYKVVLALHPRTKKILIENNLLKLLINHPHIRVLDPPPNFHESIHLQQHAKIVLTDSGGLQEEACILGTPCITLRENTERPETVNCGANTLAGFNTVKIIDAVKNVLTQQTVWYHPYGPPGVSDKILNILSQKTK